MARMPLDRHLLREERADPDQAAGLTGLLTQIAWAAKLIARELRQAGLGALLGTTGALNVQGEAEQAGGRASTGTARVLDLRPVSIHQRVPLIIGSPEEVSLTESFVRDAPWSRGEM